MGVEGAVAERNAVVCPECKSLMSYNEDKPRIVFCGRCGHRFRPSEKDIEKGKDRKKLLEEAFEKTRG